jgi:hypothetical protein
MNPSEDYTANTFILVWDMHGLESCVNATQVDREKVWDMLADKTVLNDKVGHIMSIFTLQAKCNPQRHYEIYAIDVGLEIDEDDLVNSFNNNPQEIAELIRLHGRMLYSDRIPKSECVKIA